MALAKEVDEHQRRDRERMRVFEVTGQACLRAFRDRGVDRLPLAEAHAAAVALATATLPMEPKA